MFDDSVMVKTGQGWKVFIFGCGSVLSAFSLVAGVELLGGKEIPFALCLILLWLSPAFRFAVRIGARVGSGLPLRELG